MAQPIQATTEKTKTIVINNREALITAQMPHLKLDPNAQSKVPQLGDLVVFIPGANLVDSAKLRTLRENKAFDVLFSTKIPRSLAPEQNPEKVGKFILVAGKEVPADKPLSRLEAKEACELVTEEFLSVGMLREALADEGRNEVRAAISERIKLLESGGEPISAGR